MELDFSFGCYAGYVDTGKLADFFLLCFCIAGGQNVTENDALIRFHIEGVIAMPAKEHRPITFGIQMYFGEFVIIKVEAVGVLLFPISVEGKGI